MLRKDPEDWTICLSEGTKEEDKTFNLGEMTEIQKGQMQELLDKYWDVFACEPTQLGRTTIVQYEIHVEEGPPIKQRYYSTSKLEHEFIGKEIGRLKEMGLIHLSYSPWASPVVLVKKKNGKLRLCVDYRKLNKKTKRDSYPLLRINELLGALKSSAWYTTLDLASSFLASRSPPLG